MKLYFILFVLPFHLIYPVKSNFNNEDDALLTTPQLIQKYGYPAEVHYVTTDDGYILQLHRIPSEDDDDDDVAEAVLVLHGLLGDSSTFILTGPGHALGYQLADAGYDVWLGNSRGNFYSRNHTTLNPNEDSGFWDFSFHEVGVHDLPAMIDYILDYTKNDELFYVGYSQGTSALYVMTSVKPEYNDKLMVGFCLAPVAYMNHLTSPLIRFFGLWGAPIEKIASLIEIDECFPRYTKYPRDLFISINVAVMSFGFDPAQLNSSFTSTFFAHTPAGTSFKSTVHYLQEIRSGQFCQFDKGLIKNIVTYGTYLPPKYDLEQITVPLYLFYTQNDWMSSDIDVARLHEELKTSELIFINDTKFNHANYVYGAKAPKLIYEKIIQIMEGYL